MTADRKGLYLTLITGTILDNNITGTTFWNQPIKRTINIKYRFETDTYSSFTDLRCVL